MEHVKTVTSLPTSTTLYPPVHPTTNPYPLPPTTNNPYNPNHLRSLPPTTLYPPQPHTTIHTPTPYHPVPTYSSEQSIDEILYAASE